ncbi:hypothetical protein DEU56DRAFT_918162 [Suillus clintonianus]|uniref:uncharacterized protein n=1 Tax=Suillus clintonianus TaxID=1904413 RepID=UPI001B8624A7|nr:uncharacterized protein DEU56DRAFT_918162 [Suillus clintonianus]KAG2121477.1 hypothetical protein DEU56DRAFT_918162 [Suillus clintonianus]
MPMQYPLSDPVILHKIPRSAEERIALCNMTIEIAPMARQGTHCVMFEKDDRIYQISRSCKNAFEALHYQWRKYVEMVAKLAVEVDRGRVDPLRLQLYTSVVAYLKDVMFAFKEETDALGNDFGDVLHRSARLDFHYALVLSGGTFTESNQRKMERKFHVKWIDFKTGVNIPELAKLTAPSDFHALLCGDDENLCGLYGVKHSDASLTMIDRYVEQNVTAWLESHPSVPHVEVLPEPGPSRKGKAKQLDEVTSKQVNRLGGVPTTRSATRTESLKIKIPVSKMRQRKEDDSPHMAQSSTMKGTAPMEKDIEDVPSRLNVSKERMAQTVQKRQTTPSIDNDNTAVTRPGATGTPSSNVSTKACRTEDEKGLGDKPRRKGRTGGGKRQRKTSIIPASPRQPESEDGDDVPVRNESIIASVPGTLKLFPGRSDRADDRAAVVGSNTGSKAIGSLATTSDKELLRRAHLYGNGQKIADNTLIWLIRRYRALSGIPLDEDFNGQLMEQSPKEASFQEYDDYLEALGLERFYVALNHSQDSSYHLIHLFHALGKAALTTNLLSHSSSRVDSVDPLPTLTSKRANDHDMVVTITEDVEVLDDHEAVGVDGPDLSSDGMAVDEEMAHITKKAVPAVPAHPMIVSTNGGTLKYLESLCEASEGERKRKRAKSLTMSPNKEEGGGGDSKRSKLLGDRRSIGQSSSLVLQTPGDGLTQLHTRLVSETPHVSTGQAEVGIPIFVPATQTIATRSYEPSTNGSKATQHAGYHPKVAQVEGSMSSLAIHGIVNANKIHPLPPTDKVQALGTAQGGAPHGPTEADTQAWLNDWGESDAAVGLA